jgi:hypothetical protein
LDSATFLVVAFHVLSVNVDDVVDVELADATAGEEGAGVAGGVQGKTEATIATADAFKVRGISERVDASSFTDICRYRKYFPENCGERRGDFRIQQTFLMPKPLSERLG